MVKRGNVTTAHPTGNTYVAVQSKKLVKQQKTLKKHTIQLR